MVGAIKYPPMIGGSFFNLPKWNVHEVLMVFLALWLKLSYVYYSIMRHGRIFQVIWMNKLDRVQHVTPRYKWFQTFKNVRVWSCTWSDLNLGINWNIYAALFCHWDLMSTLMKKLSVLQFSKSFKRPFASSENCKQSSKEVAQWNIIGV